ncbi:hypothetical protein OESDEN_21077 [Oesophagostomum dentatum]|uniref:DDE Tnp4 domain-containing protein n=1 Tax=Oesophagostomum dentatum TaxID=61180 RepID=A0A0B1S7U0_OESDE|nr:hypothetical protein OESDEN_21077 [Oesophagostomum dentatum]
MSHLMQTLQALNALSELVDAMDREEKLRECVRREHVPFLETRFRTFEEYLSSQTPDSFLHYTRLFPSEFEDLHARLEPCLTRGRNHIAPLTSRHRLCIFLRYVGHGSHYGSLAEDLSCGATTVSKVVMEVSNSINRVLRADAIPAITRQSLIDTSVKAQHRYDYPRAVGFMDGKHIALKKPAHSGSTYWNYKSFYSIILLAVCDCDYNFISFDVGSPGRAGDAGVFRNSDIKDFFENNDHLFPEAAPLSDVGEVQYHILVDGGFGMSHRYIRPYAETANSDESQRRFNAKHSGARRMIESSFGILVRRFAILQKAMQVEPKKAAKIVKSLIILHNLLARRQDVLATSERFSMPNTHEAFAPLQPMPRGGGPDSAKEARNRLKTYYENLYGV